MQQRPEDYDYVIFHQPNPKFPTRAMRDLGFRSPNSGRPVCWSRRSATPMPVRAMIGLTAVLDVARPGQRILMVSYGSGAGSDAFDLLVTDRIVDAQLRAPNHA